MSELNNKFQQLTGINNFDVDAYIEAAEDKTKAYNELQWKVAKGAMRKTELLRGQKSETIKLYGEVMTGLASACGVSNDKTDVANIDINSNDSTTDAEDKAAQDALSEAYAILDYDDEESGEGSSSN